MKISDFNLVLIVNDKDGQQKNIILTQKNNPIDKSDYFKTILSQKKI